MEKRIRTQGGIMQEQDGCEVKMKESWKVCEGLQGWLRKRWWWWWWWWWWSCDSTFNIWLEKGVLGKTRNRPSFSLPRGGGGMSFLLGPAFVGEPMCRIGLD